MPPIPKLNDPSWGTIASPVLAFLARRPAGIKQVLQWARKHRMQYAIARNALSYLSLTGKAYFDDLPGRWKAGCVLAPSSIYSPSAVPSFDDPVDMGRLLRLLDSRSHGVLAQHREATRSLGSPSLEAGEKDSGLHLQSHQFARRPLLILPANVAGMIGSQLPGSPRACSPDRETLIDIKTHSNFCLQQPDLHHVALLSCIVIPSERSVKMKFQEKDRKILRE